MVIGKFSLLPVFFNCEPITENLEQLQFLNPSLFDRVAGDINPLTLMFESGDFTRAASVRVWASAVKDASGRQIYGSRHLPLQLYVFVSVVVKVGNSAEKSPCIGMSGRVE